MNEFAIRARDLRKVYRLYAKPSYRFFDMLGLLSPRPEAYSEHPALDGVSLDVKRGEKVAIIGRNGAGKSTLLKLVTNVTEPTSGTLHVFGKVHALLQIGSGFHPDFTGRENVYAYLAQLGVSGSEANRLCDEIVDFAELETYIDQPVKTYSTGMAVRLMFATSTAITPDLLVLDEVLGVGDAYFAHKSYNRIRALADGAGTTLLLVTHDVYSAIKLCPRVIWIDRGRVLMDGEAERVVKGYEDSIRQQEEERLRVKKEQRLAALAKASQEVDADYVILEIASVNAAPQPGPVHFREISLRQGDRLVAMLPLGEDATDERLASHLQREGSAWGPPETADGKPARALVNYGSSFHKAAGVFRIAKSDGPLESLTCALEYRAAEGCDLVVRLRSGPRELVLGNISGVADDWTAWSGGAVRVNASSALSISEIGVHGTGAIVVRSARFVAETGEETFFLQHGAPARLEIDYAIHDPTIRERPHVVVAVHKDGVQDVCRFISRELFLDGSTQPRGTIRLSLPQLTLTEGRYSITVMVAREGYYDTEQTVFYTINPGVYCCVSRLFDVQVTGAGLIGNGTMHVLPGCWSLQPQ